MPIHSAKNAASLATIRAAPRPACAAAAAQGRAGSVIVIHALQALALAASSQEASAVDTLAETLTLACPQGYARVFADEGAPMSALLGQLVAAQRASPAAASIPLGGLAQVLRALGAEDTAPSPGPGTAASVPGLVEPLMPDSGRAFRRMADHAGFRR